MTHRGPFQPLTFCHSVIATPQESPGLILYTNHRNGAGSRHRVEHFLAQEEKEGFRCWRQQGRALARKAGTAGPGSMI